MKISDKNVVSILSKRLKTKTLSLYEMWIYDFIVKFYRYSDGVQDLVKNISEHNPSEKRIEKECNKIINEFFK